MKMTTLQRNKQDLKKEQGGKLRLALLLKNGSFWSIFRFYGVIYIDIFTVYSIISLKTFTILFPEGWIFGGE